MTAAPNGEHRDAAIEPLVEPQAAAPNGEQSDAAPVQPPAPNAEQSDAATEPLVATEGQEIAKFEAWLATAAYNDAKRLLENAWKSELQYALKRDVHDADELKGKIEASILSLSRIGDTNHTDNPERLKNHVRAILTAAAFERFAATRSQSTASEQTTKREIEKLRSLTTRLAKHID